MEGLLTVCERAEQREPVPLKKIEQQNPWHQRDAVPRVWKFSDRHAAVPPLCTPRSLPDKGIPGQALSRPLSNHFYRLNITDDSFQKSGPVLARRRQAQCGDHSVGPNRHRPRHSFRKWNRPSCPKALFRCTPKHPLTSRQPTQPGRMLHSDFPFLTSHAP